MVQFVASPDVGAEVLFDFHSFGEWSDDDVWPGHDGFTLGAPSLEGEAGAYGVEYGLRQLSFNLLIRGSHSDAVAQSAALARHLVSASARTRWLMFQFSKSSAPIWFKTWRTAPGDIDFELVDSSRARNIWGIPITLDAEPFAYGERVTIPAFTVNNDPDASTNPCMVVLPEILGDAPAQARYELVAAATHSIPSPMFSVTPVPDSFTAPIVIQFGTGDTVTPGTDMNAAGGSTSYSGGSYRPIDFATDSSLVKRATVPVPAGTRPGRYALMLRAARSSTADVIAFRAGVHGRILGDTVTMDRPVTSTGGYAQWLDLGTFTLPPGGVDYDTAAMTATNLEIHVQRVTGATFGVNLDVLVLMPVELLDGEPGQRLTVLPDAIPASPSRFRIDGDTESFQKFTSNAVAPANYPLPDGQIPVLSPGRRNVLHFFRQTQSAAREDGILGDQRATVDNRDAVTMTTTITVSYAPRFLWLAS